MAEQKSFDVFLSHNSADKAVVELLAGRLEDEARLKPFLDKWHLIPGNPWQEELEKALDNSRTCAVFIGQTGIGPWENEEMRSALETRVGQPAFRVVPVLLPGATMPDPGSLPRFLSRLTWVDFRRPEGVRDTNEFHRLVAGINGTAPGRDASWSEPLLVNECPYRGLKVFGEEHARFFFGRASTIQHLIESLRPTRFLAVLGASGSGKSSVVRAGLLPGLRAGALPLSEQWRYFIFKPGAHPIEELALRLASAELTDRTAYALRLGNSLNSDERALHMEVRLKLTDQSPGVRCCIVVDQFEEVFTLCQERSERERFVDLLRYAGTVARGQTMVILTMRTDFLSRAVEYSPLAELLSAHQFLISPMDKENLREAIEEPARVVALGWEEGLVNTITQDIGNEPGMLPLLEDALFQLWETRNDKNVMTLSSYHANGGVRGALAKRADTLFLTLSSEQQKVARRILLRLTQPGEGTSDTRRRTSLQELETRAEDSEAVNAVVQTLTDARLLVTEEQQVDVAHEALIRGWPRLRQWIDDDRNGLGIHRRITDNAEEWRRLNRDAGVLLRGAPLANAQEWRVQYETELNALEREFLDASVKLKTREEVNQLRAKRRAKRSIWLQWMSATIMGIAMGFIMNWTIAKVILGGNLEFSASPMITFSGVRLTMALFGAGLGFAQWIVLRQRLNHAGWWILATTLGVPVGVGVVEMYLTAANRFVDFAVFGGLVGTELVFAQWIVKGHRLSPANRWVLKTAVGLAVGLAIGLAVGLTYPQRPKIGFGYDFWYDSVRTPVFGALFGAGLGFAQWIVLRQRLNHAGWWILATALGVPVGRKVDLWVVRELYTWGPGDPDVLNVLDAVTGLGGGVIMFGGIGGAIIFGGITGLLLIRLIQHPKSEM